MAEIWLIISFLGGASLCFFAVNNFRYPPLGKERKKDKTAYLINSALPIKEKQKLEIADQTIVLKISNKPPEALPSILNKK